MGWPPSCFNQRVTKSIFLDYAAGQNNPNAIYKEGREARRRLEAARARIGRVLRVATDEIVFAPWGTEANQAILNIRVRHTMSDVHAITTSIEHKSVLDVFKTLEERGAGVTYLAPDSEGFISVRQVEGALRPNTILVSVMYANNEIGTIQPIKQIARMLRMAANMKSSTKYPLAAPPAAGRESESRAGGISRGFSGMISDSPIIFHSDCVQAPGLLPIDMQSLGVDMASFSAPKFGGPAGAAFLYVRRSTLNRITGLRDTCPLPLAEQMAEALEQTLKLNKPDKLLKLRDYFVDRVLKEIPGSELNGSLDNRLANNTNFVLPIDAELCVLELDAAGIAASAGAACSARDCDDGSHVIMALGRTKDEASRSVRFSMGRDTTKRDLDYVIKVLQKIINKHTNIWKE